MWQHSCVEPSEGCLDFDTSHHDSGARRNDPITVLSLASEAASQLLAYLNALLPEKRLRTPAIAAAYGGVFEIVWWPAITIFVRSTSVRCFDGRTPHPRLEYEFAASRMPAAALEGIAQWLRSEDHDATIWTEEGDVTDDEGEDDEQWGE